MQGIIDAIIIVACIKPPHCKQTHDAPHEVSTHQLSLTGGKSHACVKYSNT